MKQKILITTSIDYTNDVIHIGHAYQKIFADALTRYYKLAGYQVFFLTGTDEHGINIQQSAEKQTLSPKEYVDMISSADRDQLNSLSVKYDRFIRTTDPDHVQTVKKFWDLSLKKGDIYLSKFSGFYCNGCESFKTSSELIEGKCPMHPSKTIQEVSEINYFFRWSKYKKFLLLYLESHKDFINPQFRSKEMVNFLLDDLQDISISRTREKIPWGIPVPDDLSQTIYVWFDALVNYYTGAASLGFWDEHTKIIHILGKDILRWHALLWPAMLQSVGFKVPDQIFCHGFLNINGQKISKSLGNIIRPQEMIEKYGLAATRYYLLKNGPEIEDADISTTDLIKVYNSDLADGIGNLVQRITKLCISSNVIVKNEGYSFSNEISQLITNYKLHDAICSIQGKCKALDQYLNKNQPWHQKGNKQKEILRRSVNHLRQIVFDLQPFLPEETEDIKKLIWNEKILFGNPIFPRKIK